MNYPAKFDAASFIFGGEIRNRTNTKTLTVTDISTPWLSACADKKLLYCNELACSQTLACIIYTDDSTTELLAYDVATFKGVYI